MDEMSIMVQMQLYHICFQTYTGRVILANGINQYLIQIIFNKNKTSKNLTMLKFYSSFVFHKSKTS